MRYGFCHARGGSNTRYSIGSGFGANRKRENYFSARELPNMRYKTGTRRGKSSDFLSEQTLSSESTVTT